MTAVAVVDVGKSGLRLSMRDDRGARDGLDAVPLSPAEQGDHGSRIGARIVGLLRELDAPPSLSVVAVGATADFGEDERTSLAATVQDAFPAALIASGDDGTLAHARLVGGVGSLLAVGTGVIAIALDRGGALRRYDGWGPLLGDRGGAADLGREALRVAHIQHDRGADSAVLRSAVAEFGPPSVLSARAITSDPQWPVKLAQFGGQVAGLAEQGCETASVLVTEAAERLALTASIAAAHAGDDAVIVTGRFGSLPAIRTALAIAFRNRGLVVVNRDAPLHDLDVSRLLAGPHRSVLHVTPPRRSP